MKRYVKVLSVLMALLMVVGVFSACKKEDSPEEKAVAAYKALSTNTEKLFYVAPVSHPTADKLASITAGADALSGVFDSFKDGKTFKTDFSFNLDKLVFQDNDYLETLGGPLSLSGEMLFNNNGANFGLSGKAAGVTVDADIYADQNAMMIDCPFVFNKPIYVKTATLSDIVTGLYNVYDSAIPEGGSVSDLSAKANKLLEALTEWQNQKLTDENIKHLGDLLIGLLPEESVTVKNVTVPELKGEFNTTNVEAECVTLTIDANCIKKVFSNFSSSFMTDAVVKDLIVSFLDKLIEAGVLTEKDTDSKNGEALYEKLCDEIKKEFDEAKDEEYDSDASVIINRYFVNGFGVKLDIIAKEGNETKADLTCWNIYKGDASQYGAKLVVDGNEYLKVVGGANKNDAKLEINYKYASSSADEGEQSFKLLFNRKGDSLSIDGTFKIDPENVDMEFTYNGDSTNGSANLVVNSEGKKVGDFKLTTKKENDKNTINGVFTIAEENGEEHKVNLGVEVVKKVTDNKYESTTSFNINSEGVFDIKGSYSCNYDLDSAEALVVPKEEGSFVINDISDLSGIMENISPTILDLLGNSGNTAPEEF